MQYPSALFSRFFSRGTSSKTVPCPGCAYDASLHSGHLYTLGSIVTDFFLENLCTLVSVVLDFTAYAAVQPGRIGRHYRRLAIQ